MALDGIVFEASTSILLQRHHKFWY
jgi:hypothetical protein